MKVWWLLSVLLLGCSSQLPARGELQSDEEFITAERTFPLGLTQATTTALPEGLSLTVQVITSGSATKPGWKAARAKLVYQGQAPQTVDLIYTLYARVPADSGPLEPAIQRMSSVWLDPTSYASGRISRSRTTPYVDSNRLRPQAPVWCAGVVLAGDPAGQEYLVCEPPATPEAARLALEPLAARVRLQTDGPQNLRFGLADGVPPDGWSYPPQPFAEWVAPYLSQPDTAQARAWRAFAAELRRWFGSSLQVYVEELPCHNCHEFALAIVGDGGGWYGGFFTSIVWDSALR